jgi:hypothetical protein
MRRNQNLGVSIFGVFLMSSAMWAQSVPAAEKPIPVPTDWSHHHVIFSKPGTTEQAARVEKDPRYWQQLYRSQLPVRPSTAENRDGLAFGSNKKAKSPPPPKHKKAAGYWAESLGSGASVGAGNYPAKFSFLGTSANCGDATQPDFVVYSTGLLGSTGQASIVAYDNLYSGCSGTVPRVYWAYNTGGQILTSPTFSRDGTQVAFVQTVGGFGILVLLKWAPSTTQAVGAPDTLTAVSTSAYPGCTAPCMTQIFIEDHSGTDINDTTSSVFVDYSGDTAWVGGALGWLHKITPFFEGVPAEVHAAGFPLQVNEGDSLSSPVHDYMSGNIFVGDAGGYIYRVDPTTAAVTASGQLDFGTGIVGSPEVDSTAGLVYVFASSDGSASCVSGAACAAVYQLSANFSAGDFGSEVTVGNSVVYGSLPNPNPLYDGDFDSNYKNSANATGNLYVCGNTGGTPTLYRVPITAGTMGEVVPGPSLSTASSTASCSPVTDILNPNTSGGATEWIFVSTGAGAVPSGCASGGCVLNFKSTSWLPSTLYSVGQEVLDTGLHIEVVKTAGTSGVTVPIWNGTTGQPTPDGSVTWLDQGLLSASTPAAWTASHTYRTGTLILDNNGNIELVTNNGTSGAAVPTFNTTAGGTTADGSTGLVWTNLGAIATNALASAGGSSGIIIDNFVGSGTLPGTSQVYFSTLSNQATCGTSSSVGCAVQASQSALK